MAKLYAATGASKTRSSGRPTSTRPLASLSPVMRGRAMSSACAETERRWRVVGTIAGKLQTRFVLAWDHNEAVRKASGPGYMLCVRVCVLID